MNGNYVIEGDVVAIDGIDAEYEPLCGECYIKNVYQKQPNSLIKKLSLNTKL